MLVRYFFALVVLTGLLVPSVFPSSATAWELQIVQFGYDVDRDKGQLKTVKNEFMTTEPWPEQLVRFIRPPWPTNIANQASGPPGSRAMSREYQLRWDPSWASARISFTFPILGTDLEEWVGTWTARVLVDGKEIVSSTFVITKGNPAEGIERFQKEVAANPKSFWSQYYLGAVLAQAGQTDAALQHLQEASKIARTSFWPWYTLGRIYQRLGKKDDARNAYATVKGLLMGYDDPSLSRIFARWADLHLQELE